MWSLFSLKNDQKWWNLTIILILPYTDGVFGSIFYILGRFAKCPPIIFFPRDFFFPPVKIFEFPSVKKWTFPWKCLENCPWKLKSPREIFRQISPVKTENGGREKNENFHPWKAQKCPWKKILNFHEIYEESILIMKFVTITCRNLSIGDFLS